jgi:hypothetical protein
MVCFRYVIVNTVHKDDGGGGGVDNEDDNNIYAMRAACPIFIILLELTVRKIWRKLKTV